MKPKARYQTSEVRNQRSGIKLTSDLWLLASCFCLLILAGCATAPKPVPPAPQILSPQTAPAAPAETKPSAPSPKPPPAPPNPAVPPASISTPSLEKDESILAIDSQPAGAIVVVNGIPIGKAPLRLKVNVTPQGFFRDYVTVKARFLATNAAETSQTVEEDFTPLQKIPAEILFTSAGAHRREK